MKTPIISLFILLCLCSCDLFKGTDGANGTDGTNGATWLYGSGAPTDSQGSVGDFYLDTSTSNAYGKESTGWKLLVCIQGGTGSNGVNGAIWHVGTGAPAASLGADGDLYLDSGSGVIYRKESGAWKSYMNVTGASIRKSDTVKAGKDLTLTHNLTPADKEALTYVGEFVVDGKVYPWDAYANVFPALSAEQEVESFWYTNLSAPYDFTMKGAALPSGKFVAAYDAYDSEGGWFIFVTEFDADMGVIDTYEFSPLTSLFCFDVVAVPDVGFVVILGNKEAAWAINAYIFTEVESGELEVPVEYPLVDASQYYVTTIDAETLPDGHVAVLWSGPASSEGARTCFLTFDPADGEKPAPAVVETCEGQSNPHPSVSLAALSNGTLVAAYLWDEAANGRIGTAVLQRLDGDGNKIGSPIEDMFHPENAGYCKVVGLAGGGFVVAYKSGTDWDYLTYDSIDSDPGRFIVFDSDGFPMAQATLGGTFAARPVQDQFVSFVDVTALSNGGFAVAYRRLDSHYGIPSALRLALFSAGGARLAADETVMTHEYYPGDGSYPDFMTVSLSSHASRIFVTAGAMDWDFGEGSNHIGDSYAAGLYRADSLALTEDVDAHSATLWNYTSQDLELRLSVVR